MPLGIPLSPAQRKPISDKTRLFVLKRDGYKCKYCGTSDELHVDHVVPASKGGSNHVSNLVAACRGCNQSKGSGLAPVPQNGQVRHPLVGMGMHVLDAQGDIVKQGEVIGVDGDVVIVRIFSWMDGCPTWVEVFQKQEIYSNACRLYQDVEAMRETGDAWMREYLRKS